MSMIRQIYVLKDHAASLGLTLSDEDLAKIETTVDSVLAESEDVLIEAYNLTRERMIEIYKNNALANLAWEALVADVDTNVPDEDVRCVGASYVFVEETDVKAKENAQKIYDAVKGGATLEDAVKDQELTVTESAYLAGNEYEENTLGHKAVGMQEGEVAMFELTEGEGWYVMVLDTLMDEEATQSQRDSVIAERQAEMFNEKYPELEKASATFTVDEKVWQNITMGSFFVAS